MHYIPGLRLRVSEEEEIIGIDDAEMGEFAYDYVGLEQEIGHSVEHLPERCQLDNFSGKQENVQPMHMQ